LGDTLIMNGIEQKLYEWTIPELVRQLGRLNDNLEKLINIEEHAFQPPEESLSEINNRIQGNMAKITNIKDSS